MDIQVCSGYKIIQQNIMSSQSDFGHILPHIYMVTLKTYSQVIACTYARIL